MEQQNFTPSPNPRRRSLNYLILNQKKKFNIDPQQQSEVYQDENDPNLQAPVFDGNVDIENPTQNLEQLKDEGTRGKQAKAFDAINNLNDISVGKFDDYDINLQNLSVGLEKDRNLINKQFQENSPTLQKVNVNLQDWLKRYQNSGSNFKNQTFDERKKPQSRQLNQYNPSIINLHQVQSYSTGKHSCKKKLVNVEKSSKSSWMFNLLMCNSQTANLQPEQLRLGPYANNKNLYVSPTNTSNMNNSSNNLIKNNGYSTQYGENHNNEVVQEKQITEESLIQNNNCFHHSRQFSYDPGTNSKLRSKGITISESKKDVIQQDFDPNEMFPGSNSNRKKLQHILNDLQYLFRNSRPSSASTASQKVYSQTPSSSIFSHKNSNVMLAQQGKMTYKNESNVETSFFTSNNFNRMPGRKISSPNKIASQTQSIKNLHNPGNQEFVNQIDIPLDISKIEEDKSLFDPEELIPAAPTHVYSSRVRTAPSQKSIRCNPNQISSINHLSKNASLSNKAQLHNNFMLKSDQVRPPSSYGSNVNSQYFDFQLRQSQSNLNLENQPELDLSQISAIEASYQNFIDQRSPQIVKAEGAQPDGQKQYLKDNNNYLENYRLILHRAIKYANRQDIESLLKVSNNIDQSAAFNTRQPSLQTYNRNAKTSNNSPLDLKRTNNDQEDEELYKQGKISLTQANSRSSLFLQTNYSNLNSKSPNNRRKLHNSNDGRIPDRKTKRNELIEQFLRFGKRADSKPEKDFQFVVENQNRSSAACYEKLNNTQPSAVQENNNKMSQQQTTQQSTINFQIHSQTTALNRNIKIEDKVNGIVKQNLDIRRKTIQQLAISAINYSNVHY